MAGFTLAVAPEFKAEAEITPPGAGDLVKLPVTFRHKTKTALGEWIAGLTTRPAVDSLDEVLVAWEADVPYSREALTTLLETWPAPGDELIRTYLRALTESRAKN